MAVTDLNVNCTTASGSAAGFVRDIAVYLDGNRIGEFPHMIPDDDPANEIPFAWQINYRIEGSGRVVITDLTARDVYEGGPEHVVAVYDLECPVTTTTSTTTTSTVPPTSTSTTTTTISETTVSSMPSTTTTSTTVPPSDPTVPPSNPVLDDPDPTTPTTGVATTVPSTTATTAAQTGTTVATSTTLAISTVASSVPQTVTSQGLALTGGNVFGMLLLGAAFLGAGLVAMVARGKGRKPAAH